MNARRREPEEQANHERWLVSYADFITLLFAFFVVMYAISTLNEGKYRVLSDSLNIAFRHDRVVTPQMAGMSPMNLNSPRTPSRPGAKAVDPLRRDQERKLLQVASQITQALQPLVQTGQVRLTQLPHGLAVEISASVLFAPGKAELQPEAVAALTLVAPILSGIEDPIQVEGHTDNLPIASSVYPSNWELAAARASSVVRVFTANGVPANRVAAVSYAENRPIESNDTPDGRARNRRVTLMIVAAQPGASGTGANAAAAPGAPSTGGNVAPPAPPAAPEAPAPQAALPKSPSGAPL